MRDKRLMLKPNKNVLLRNLLNHIITLLAIDIAMYSDSVEDKFTQFYFLEDQATIAPPKVSLHPLMDFILSLFELSPICTTIAFKYKN